MGEEQLVDPPNEYITPVNVPYIIRKSKLTTHLNIIIAFKGEM